MLETLAALPLPVIIAELAYAAMILSLLLIVFVPFFPGVAVIFGSVLVWVGYNSFLVHGFAGIHPVTAGFVLVFSFLGLFSSWWTEKWGVRFTYASQEVSYGMLVGSLAFGMILKTMFWFMIGMLIGGVAMEMRSGRPFREALRQGVGAIYSALGPRGWQLMMAMLIADTATPLGLPFAIMRGWL